MSVHTIKQVLPVNGAPQSSKDLDPHSNITADKHAHAFTKGSDNDNDNNDEPKSIANLEAIVGSLIDELHQDVVDFHLPHDEFWLSKAKESLDDFNDALNDYLIKKNERNLTGIDYNCIYIYYRAAKIILTEVIPELDSFRKIQTDYSLLMSELLNNDMYFLEIKSIIEKRTSSTSVDPLLARFNNLKRSFSSSTKPTSYIHGQPPLVLQPKPRTSKDELMSVPRSNSRSPTPAYFPETGLNSPQTSEIFQRAITPTINPPNFNEFIQSPVGRRSVSGLKSPSGSSTSLIYFSPEKEKDPFSRFEDNDSLKPQELNDLVSQYSHEVLVIDFRSTTEFNYSHIYFANSSNVIHIDPLSLGKDYNAHNLETKGMVTNSKHEVNLFQNRRRFELVVVYNQNGVKDSHVLRLFTLLQDDEVPLKRRPAFLQGGLNSWSHLYGAPGLASNLGIIRDDLTLEVRHDSLSRPVSIPSKSNGSMDYYHSSGSGNTGLKSYNRSESDFFSLKPTSRGQTPVDSSLSKTKALPKLNVGALDKPQSALSSPRRASHTNDFSALEAQKRQSQINDFDKNLTIITGISNMGNTCYMNCILQCLVGTKGLTKFFLMNDYESKINLKSRLGSKGMISKAFHNVVKDMFSRSVVQQKSCFFIVPQKFKQTVGVLNSDFRSYQQQDCSEFLNFLLDSLHEDLNQRGDSPKFPPLSAEEEAHREKMPLRLAATIEWEKYLKTDFSSIVDFFQGQYVSRLQCTVCKGTSTTYNAFSTLTIPIPENISGPISLESCFDDFCKAEILDGDDKWYCPYCKKKQRSTKSLRISILPRNLIIHLKRFKISYTVTKLNSFVKYPLRLSLLKYWPPVSSQLEKEKVLIFPDRGQSPPFNYELYGVVNHFGSLRSGHYTAFVDKGAGSEGSKNGWCYFDDTTVTRNCDISKVINENAYVLFYRRV